MKEQAVLGGDRLFGCRTSTGALSTGTLDVRLLGVRQLVEDGASLATVVRASCPRRLEACTTNGRQIYASDY